MKLTLQNIGLIQHTEILLDGITLIVGNNSTGKSTVGRAAYLYGVCLNGMDRYIRKDRQKTIFQELNRASENLDLICKRLANAKRKRKLSEIEAHRRVVSIALASFTEDDFKTVKKVLASYMQKHVELYGLKWEDVSNDKSLKKWLDDAASRVEEVLSLSDDDIGKRRITEKLDKYFSGQILRIPSRDGEDSAEEDSYIKVENDAHESNEIVFERNKKAGRDACSAFTQDFMVDQIPVYIENPRVLDKLTKRPNLSRTEVLDLVFAPNAESLELANYYDGMVSAYFQDFMQIVARFTDDGDDAQLESKSGTTAIQLEQYTRNVKSLEEKLDEIVGGQLVKTNPKGIQFQQENLVRSIEITSMSTGIKALSLLRYALEKGCIQRGSILILDEPEINLHPEWQIKYAETIVEMQKLFDLRIVITTHSPYFMQAVEYSTKLKGIKERYHCYLAEYAHGKSRISCVDSFPSMGYKKLIEAFAVLEQMKAECERIGEE